MPYAKKCCRNSCAVHIWLTYQCAVVELLGEAHEGSKVSVGWLYLEQARHHLMGQDDWLEFAFGLALVAVLPG